MKKLYKIFGIAFSAALILFTVAAINAQAAEVYTGTVLYYGSGLSTRTVTRQFTLTVDSYTPDDESDKYLNILKDDGQDALLKAIGSKEVGRFSVGANIGVPVNVVREKLVDGKRRILVVFERWTQFAELRYGYRSLDYPFGYIELMIDENTGKGEGTYIAAAKIRWNSYNKTNDVTQIEVENFATFPARLLAVKRSFKNLP